MAGVESRAVTIDRALRDSRRTLALLSEAFLDSPYCKQEWTSVTAQDPVQDKRKLVPIRVGPCKPSGLLGAIVWIDLLGLSEDQSREKLVAQMRFVEQGDTGDGADGGEPGPTPSGAARRAPPARVHLVAVASELDGAAAAITKALGTDSRARVLRRDPADASFQPPASGPDDLPVVLLGGRIGVGDGMARTLALVPAPRAFKLKPFDSEESPPAEREAALALRAGPAVNAPTFGNDADVAAKATRIVKEWLDSREPSQSPSHLLVWEKTYLCQRGASWRKGRPGPLASRLRGQEFDRARLYVPLRALPEWVGEDEAGNLVLVRPRLAEGARGGVRSARPTSAAQLGEALGVGAGAEDAGGDAGGIDLKPALLERVVTQPSAPWVVVIGEAGSGKTVLLQHLAWALACEHVPDGADGDSREGTRGDPGNISHALDLAALCGDGAAPPIPILVEASRLARRLGEAGGRNGLLQALADEVEEGSGTRPELAALHRGLLARRYWVLVDSLDEVPGEAARRRVVECLEGLSREPRAPRLVLTTRPTAHVGSVRFEGRLRPVNLAPMDDEAARALARRWAQNQVWPADQAQRFLEEALPELTHRQETRFSENPLLLTCCLLVFGQQWRLPDSPAELYHRMVDILCETLTTGLTPTERRQMLERVFEHLQGQGGTEAPADDAARVLVKAGVWSLVDVEQGREALARLGAETGLLRFEAGIQDGHPVQRVRPWHRSFQQFGAACRVVNLQGDPEASLAFLYGGGGADPRPDAPTPPRNNQGEPAAEDPVWEGVLRFVPGIYGMKDADLARRWLAALHGRRASASRRGRVYGLMLAAVTEYREHFQGDALASALPAEFVAVFDREGEAWPLADRLLALEALGRVEGGDPRLGLDRVWVRVLADDFRLGGDSGAFQKAPAHRAVLPEFLVAWRPVTVDDMATFVDSGWKVDRWWEAGRDQFSGDEPALWAQQRHHRNHPVWGVDWFTAKAFCAWATVHWPGVPKGCRVDLPTEDQWEAVARGTAGRIFPWSIPGKAVQNDATEAGFRDTARANHSWDKPYSGGVGRTTPVGAFPAGNAGSIVELAGNVWEWCRDAWRGEGGDKWKHDVNNYCHVGDKRSPRAVRGGSWRDPPWYLRCAARSRYVPRRRHDDLGFRVVCVSVFEHGGLAP